MKSPSPLLRTLNQEFPGRVLTPAGLADIPDGDLVYLFAWQGRPIVVGRGTRTRARVIFDDATQITRPHLKSLFVRLCHLYGGGAAHAERYLIPCESGIEARQVEKILHKKIGGNNRAVDPAVLAALFDGIATDSVPWLVLRQALTSAFDGQDDLCRWWRQGLIHEHDWEVVRSRLRLRCRGERPAEESDDDAGKAAAASASNFRPRGRRRTS